MDRENRSKAGKRFLGTIGAGVIGSMLTLGVVMNTDLMTTAPQEPIATAVKDSSYSVEQLAASV